MESFHHVSVCGFVSAWHCHSLHVLVFVVLIIFIGESICSPCMLCMAFILYFHKRHLPTYGFYLSYFFSFHFYGLLVATISIDKESLL